MRFFHSTAFFHIQDGVEVHRRDLSPRPDGQDKKTAQTGGINDKKACQDGQDKKTAQTGGIEDKKACPNGQDKKTRPDGRD